MRCARSAGLGDWGLGERSEVGLEPFVVGHPLREAPRHTHVILVSEVGACDFSGLEREDQVVVIHANKLARVGGLHELDHRV